MLFSCGENDENQPEGQPPITENGGGGEEKEEQESAKYKAISIEIDSLEMSREGGSLVLKGATLCLEPTDDGGLLGEGEALATVIDGEEERELSARLAISDGNVYVGTSSDGEAEQILIYELSVLIDGIKEKTGVDVLGLFEAQEKREKLSVWFTDKLMTSLGSINSAVILARIEEYSAKLSDEFIKEGDAGGFFVDLSEIGKLNEAFSQMTVKDAYEHLFEESSFVDFKAGVAGMLALSLNDLILGLEKNGASREKIFAALDSLAAILLDDESATLEQLLGLEYDIEDMLSDPETASYTFSSFLKSVTGCESDSELSDMLSRFYAELSKSTLYEYIGAKTGVDALCLESLIGDISRGARIELSEGVGSLSSILITYLPSGEDSTADVPIKELFLYYSNGEIELKISSNEPRLMLCECKLSFSLSESSLVLGEIYKQLTESISNADR